MSMPNKKILKNKSPEITC